MKKSVWKRIAQVFNLASRKPRCDARQNAEYNERAACPAPGATYCDDTDDATEHSDTKGMVEFRFSFDPNDTMLLPLEGKRMQCPCCDDEFTAFPDGAVACSRCVGTMQGKHLRDKQLHLLG
jgi:hypothetical protein